MDNNKTSWWQKQRPTTRRLIQVYSALLHNAYVKGFLSGEIYKGEGGCGSLYSLQRLHFRM